MKVVDQTTELVVASLAGQSVELVIYEDGVTKLTQATVVATSPLQLSANILAGGGVRAGRRVMIVGHVSGVSLRAEGHLDAVHWGEKASKLDISNVHWEILDRRRHRRVDVDVPVVMKLVQEERGQPVIVSTVGRASDLSISGAQVWMESVPASGTLVNLMLTIEGKEVRVLALVAHVNSDGGAGIHFLEYFKNARHDIYEFLAGKAA